MELEPYTPYLRLLARVHVPRRLRGKVAASDIVQQTLLKAFENQHTFRGTTEREVAAWLATILTRTVADLLRAFGRKKRDVVMEVLPPVEDSIARIELLARSSVASPSRIASRRQEILRLAEGLESLAEDQREALELHYLLGCSVAEVAEQMERSKPSVAGLIRRGLAELRDRLPADDG